MWTHAPGGRLQRHLGRRHRPRTPTAWRIQDRWLPPPGGNANFPKEESLPAVALGPSFAPPDPYSLAPFVPGGEEVPPDVSQQVSDCISGSVAPWDVPNGHTK